MEVYLSTSLVALLLTFLDSKKKLPNGMLWGFVLITFVQAIRYGCGNDYMNYYRDFELFTHESLDIIPKAMDYYHIEPGWALINFLFQPLGGFFSLIAAISIIENCIYFHVIKKYVIRPYWSLAFILYAFYTTIGYLINMTMIRQGLVISLFLLAYPIYKNGRIISKKFIICGVDDESWIAKKALKESNITTYPNMKYENWEKMCSTFDVFLYYLPKDTYSSLDGNLGLAMRLGIPPIVFGPSAPKERIIHGVNGFIANTKEEIIYYAQLLFQDDNLRKNIGKNARDTTYSMLHNRDSIEGYLNLYKTVTRKSKTYNINIPFAFSTLCTLKKYMFLIQIECNRIQRALIMLINNPARFIKKFN